MPALGTEQAAAAGHQVRRHHSLPGAVGDSCADRHHHAGELVAQYAADREIRQLATVGMQVGAADRGAGDPDNRIPFPRDTRFGQVMAQGYAVGTGEDGAAQVDLR